MRSRPLSRSLAFDGEDVLESSTRAGPGAVRLAQSRAGKPAPKNDRVMSARGRSDHAAGAAWFGADRRPGPPALPQAADDTACGYGRTLSTSRSRAGSNADPGPATRQGRQGDDAETMKPGTNGAGAMRLNGAGRRAG